MKVVEIQLDDKAKIENHDSKQTFLKPQKLPEHVPDVTNNLQPKSDARNLENRPGPSVHGFEIDLDCYQKNNENDLWPVWSSRPPVELGDYVRSVFLDLCDGRTLTELQV